MRFLLTSPKKRYLELISLAKQFIHQSEKKTLFVDPDLKTYFKSPPVKKPIIIKQPHEVIPSFKPSSPNHRVLNPVPISQSAPSFLNHENKQMTSQNFAIAQPLKISTEAKSANLMDLKTPPSPKNVPIEAKTEKITLSSKPIPLFKPEAPLISTPAYDIQGFFSFFKMHFPHIPLREKPLCDSQAKLIKNQWKLDKEIAPVLILSRNHNPMEIQFLQNLAQAIAVRFTPAKLIFLDKIEKNQQWDDLFSPSNVKLVLSCIDYLYAQPELMEIYREEKDGEKQYINQIPLIPLSDLNIYFKDPQSKSLLWRKICYQFSLPENN